MRLVMRDVLMGWTAIAAILGLGFVPAWGQTVMYWSDGGSIQSANLDGSNRQVIYQANPTTGGVNYIAADADHGKLYYYGRIGDGNTGPTFVKRSDLDGTDMETLITGTISTLYYGFALDPANGKMYMGDHYGLWSANLDGSNLKEFLPIPHNPAAQRMYPHSIAVDSANSELYYTNAINWWGPGFYGVGRVNLQDGSGLQVVVNTGNTGSTHVALDVPDNLLYFSSGNISPGSGAIGKANLDGSNQQILIPGITAYSIQYDAVGKKLYWTTIDKIQCANLDGSDVRTVLMLSTPGPWSSDSLILVSEQGTAVPLPSAAWMVLALLGSLGVMRRLRKA
jgi:hypothetical protein